MANCSAARRASDGLMQRREVRNLTGLQSVHSERFKLITDIAMALKDVNDRSRSGGMNRKPGRSNLLRRLEELEARTAPTGEPVIVDVMYVSPDGTGELGFRAELPTSTGPAWQRRWRG